MGGGGGVGGSVGLVCFGLVGIASGVPGRRWKDGVGYGWGDGMIFTIQVSGNHLLPCATWTIAIARKKRGKKAGKLGMKIDPMQGFLLA